ncbi:MAG: glycosyltransferase [Eubacterium sp.]|nr:glycosyltransferase [Eubacterium sp.]
MRRKDRNIVAFFPYSLCQTSYIHTMQGFLESKYEVIDYSDLLDEIYDLREIKSIYLNWAENVFQDKDIRLIKKAKSCGVKIVWVYHNKIPHDSDKTDMAIRTTRFLIKISDVIIVHSHQSIEILKQFEPKLKYEKVKFLAHPEFVGDYFGYAQPDETPRNKERFLFAFYSQLRPYKNIEILINAFNRLDKSYECELVIVGQAPSKEYFNLLKEMAQNNDKITLTAQYINSLEMAAYLEQADILVLPYSYKSVMNSGTMIMAFSYKRTVIVPDICMANDYDDSLIYKYTYGDEENHIHELHKKMEMAYKDGKERCREKGEKLYHIVTQDNAKNKVKEELIRIV